MNQTKIIRLHSLRRNPEHSLRALEIELQKLRGEVDRLATMLLDTTTPAPWGLGVGDRHEV